MIIHDFFLQLVIILLSARLLGEWISKYRIPSVIGELLAGVLIGPSLLHLIEPTEIIRLLAEIGLILLLFEVGLETDLLRLAHTGVKPFLVALGGVVVPFVLGFGLSYYVFHLNLLVSLFIGSTLTATSIGITVRVLTDLKRQKSDEAQIVLGAAVIDDVIGIILLSMIYELSSTGTIHYWDTGKIIIFVLLYLVLTPFLVKAISLVIERYETKSKIPGLIPTTVISLILFFSWLAQKVGAPELLGGFAAGLALSRLFFSPFKLLASPNLDFAHKVEKKMKPIIHLFTPIFFVTIGLSLNLREINWNSSLIWILSISILIAAVVGKLVSGFLLFKENKWVKWAVGLAMIPRGEVGLIFAEVGRSNQILNNDLYAVLIIVIAITTIFAPIALRLFYSYYYETDKIQDNLQKEHM